MVISDISVIVPRYGLCGSYPKADTGSIGGFRPARPEVVPKSASGKWGIPARCSPISAG